MNLSERAAATMKLVGGRLFLDFINTAGGRRSDPSQRRANPDAVVILGDKLNDYFDLLAWGRHTDSLNESDLRTLIREAGRREDEAARVLERAIALREAGYRICRAVLGKRQPHASDLDLLNREIAIARCHEKLTTASDGFVWHWTSVTSELDRMLWPVARSAAELLATGDLTRLHACGGEDCGWLFEDSSRNRSRRWCTMQDCGNLAKVRRFRTRLRDAGKSRE
jgi:predicted RNA-binding Zn ribbon-like protein